MKYLIMLFLAISLGSCEEPTLKNYKIELNTGEVYHITAYGYFLYRNSNRVEFYNDKGMFFNVKYVIVENNY